MKSLSLPELSAVLEKCVGEMGKVGEESCEVTCAGGEAWWGRLLMVW